MINIKDKAKCCGCHACASVCPKGCIVMSDDGEGFLYPVVNTEICIDCGLCERVCPILSSDSGERACVSAYAAYNNDEKVRRMGSSGGVFSALAKAVLAGGGVVFGAAMDAALELSHTYVEKERDLPKLCGSKYVQSRIGNAYVEAKSFLDGGREVLFAGTPCQIEGLYSYLGQDCDRLLTADIVCHGVPSPLVFKKYIEAKKIGRITGISFRDKSGGWRDYSLRFDKSDGRSVYTKSTDDGYMRAFLKNLSLRPSCYECAFKKRIKASDITLGDFWGVEKIHPDMDDNMGTSLVIVNSEKGKELFSRVNDQLVTKETDVDAALRYNPSAVVASARPEFRDSFMYEVKDGGFDTAAKSYLKEKLSLRIKRKIKNLLKK